MRTIPVYLTPEESQKLFDTGHPNAALLYLFLRNGNTLHDAKTGLHFSDGQILQALEVLKTAGLYHALPSPNSKPVYSENDIVGAFQRSAEFQALTRAIEEQMGRMLRTEELRILLNITNYLGLPSEVVLVLVDYCINTNSTSAGGKRSPSMYQIEKEAYRWSDAEIGTVEAAMEYIQSKSQFQGKVADIARILQIRGRKLTAPEEKYVQLWLQKGYPNELIQKAYEKACMATGGRNWSYMDKVLAAWSDKAAQASQDPQMGRNASPEEVAAVQKMLSMSTEEFLGLPDDGAY